MRGVFRRVTPPLVVQSEGGSATRQGASTPVDPNRLSLPRATSGEDNFAQRLVEGPPLLRTQEISALHPKCYRNVARTAVKLELLQTMS